MYVASGHITYVEVLRIERRASIESRVCAALSAQALCRHGMHYCAR